jgi:uncharacterized protein (TIGR02231 family)
MKRPLFLICALGIHLSFVQAWASDPQSLVTHVTLHPDGALLTRSIPVVKGMTSVTFKDLPFLFTPDDVRVEADPGITIGDLSVRTFARSTPLTPEESRLESIVLGLEQKLAFINAAQQAATLELNYLNSLLKPVESTRPAAQGQPLAALLKTISERSLNAQLRIDSAKRSKVQLEKDLQARRHDLAQIRGQAEQLALLDIRLAATQSGTVRIRYPVAQAGWRPAYRAKLDTSSGQIQFERLAVIAQRTGEDWRNVHLEIATGNIREAVSGATPSTWSLDLVKPEPPMPRMVKLRAAMAAPMAAAPPARSRENSAQDSDMAQTEMDAETPQLFEAHEHQDDFGTQYTLSHPQTIPADGRKVSVALTSQSIPARLIVQTAPRLEQAAYVIAESDLPEGAWPIGDVQLYRDGAYIGKASLDMSDTRSFSLPFGRDTQVKVKSKPLITQTDDRSLLGRDQERRYARMFEIVNMHKRPIQLNVLEATPVARNDAIKIKLRLTPSETQPNWKGQQGVVSWERPLAPGERFEIRTDYTVSWPQKDKLIDDASD